MADLFALDGRHRHGRRTPRPDEVLAWLRANPEAALEVAKNLQPVGDWEVVTIIGKGQVERIEVLRRRNHLGHVVAQVAPTSAETAGKYPDRAFCAWMTYPLRAPHGIYRASVPECLVAADAELQENPKCLLVSPRTQD